MHVFQKNIIMIDLKQLKDMEVESPAAGEAMCFKGGKWRNEAVRTANGEPLTGSGGDMNLHDGFVYPNAVQDADGNWYDAVVVGNQVWMTSNLRTKSYADGTPIPDGYQEEDSETAPYYYSNKNSDIPDKKRGLYYNAAAVTIMGDSTPMEGWHVPSSAEWSQLLQYVGSQYRYNHQLVTVVKSLAAMSGWEASSVEGSPGNTPVDNNATAFSAVPSGYRPSGDFFDEGEKAVFLDSSGNIAFVLEYNHNTQTELPVTHQKYAGSVRCVSDLSPVQFRSWYIERYGSLQHHI